MASFQYKGRKAQGGTVSGSIEAASMDAVADQLLGKGITPLQITPVAAKKGSKKGEAKGKGGSFLQELNKPKSVPLTELIFFSRQMQTLLRAGVPIMQSLASLKETSHHPLLAETIGKVAEALDGGADLPTALKRHPKVFPPLYVSMVQIGETTGNMPEAFGELTRYLERELETRAKIKAAFRYPIIVIFAITAAMFIINIFVLPKFENVFSRFGSDLPWQTQMLLGTSHFVSANWRELIGGLAAAIYGFARYIKSPKGRQVWDQYKLKLPLIGKIIFNALIARFTHSFAMISRAGVPISEGMCAVESSLDNVYLARRLAAMRESISRGDSLSQSAESLQLFPQMVIQMISVGEASGMLDEMFTEVAHYYDREVDYQLKGLSAAIEPIMLFAVGVMVLVLAMGVFLPMWDLGAAAMRKG